MRVGIIIIGHGSRLSGSRGIYEEIARKAAKKSGFEVLVGYMKHWKPTIREAVDSLVEKGIKKIVIVPLFLLPGLHVTDDIPRILGIKKGKLPEFGCGKVSIPRGVEISYAKHIGADERLADVVLDRVNEAIEGSRRDSQHFEMLRPPSSGTVRISRVETRGVKTRRLVRCRARSEATKPDKRSGLK